MKTGVCSITLRRLAPAEVVALVEKTSLSAIEWGSDAHVPAGDVKLAESVRAMTLDAGLEVASYGSYWKAVDAAGAPAPFEPYLDSARALGADTIRVWAGHKASDAVTATERAALAEHLAAAAAAAEKQGVKIALEFHANTLADSNAAARGLLDEINHPNLFTYWQPIYWLADPAYRLNGLKELAGKVLNLHVFHWLFRPGAGSWSESIDRRPLEEGAADWKTYFEVPLDPSIEHYALMEFVRGDEPEQVLRDAAALTKLLEGK